MLEATIAQLSSPVKSIETEILLRVLKDYAIPERRIFVSHTRSTK
jgi:hypothetical protein